MCWVHPYFFGWVEPISCLVRRDGSDPIFCLVVDVKWDEMDDKSTPLATLIGGAHILFTSLNFLFFSIHYLLPSSLSLY
jgi:hypothetical protein